MERNVSVSCRVRPLLPSEENLPQAAWELSEKSVSLPLAQRVNVEGKAFDRVEETFMEATYGPTASNDDVYVGFQHVVKDAVEEGLNGAILAYGQTASGKTHSILGSQKDADSGEPEVKGLMALSIEDVFKLKKDSQQIKISYMEVYLEKVNDLLGKKENLAVKEDVMGPHGGFFVDGLTEKDAANAREVLHIVHKAEKRRRVCATRYNEKSSRSHTILQMQIVTAKSDAGDGQGEALTMTGVSKLMIVDLAGNERVDEITGYTSESTSINKSLFFLGEVISKLATKDDHIPYRNSKLTAILSMHLGQNANTALLVTLHPMEEFISESLTTLRFAQKASTIKCEVRPVFQSKEHMVILRQREIITQLRERVQELETLASSTERHNAEVYVSSSKDLDNIVTTLHQNQQVLERDKTQLKDALFKVGRHMEHLARKSEEALGATVGPGDSLTRLERCIDAIEAEMGKMREMKQGMLEMKQEMKQGASEMSTREPTPVNLSPMDAESDEKLREDHARLVAAEKKAREDNARLRANAKYLAVERDKWRNECQKRADETMELLDGKDTAIRECEEKRKQAEVAMALSNSGLQTQIRDLKEQLQKVAGRPPAEEAKRSAREHLIGNISSFPSTDSKDSGIPSARRPLSSRFVHSPVQSPIRSGTQEQIDRVLSQSSRGLSKSKPADPGLPMSSRSHLSGDRQRDTGETGQDPEKAVKWSAREMFLVSPSVPEPGPTKFNCASPSRRADRVVST